MLSPTRAATVLFHKGDVLVAGTQGSLVLYAASGHERVVLATHDAAFVQSMCADSSGFFHLDLAPDNRGFWVQAGRAVYHVALGSGRILASFPNPAPDNSGLLVYGSPVVARGREG